MNQAALVLAIFSVLSQLFGLLRDHLLASRVGPSANLDVYYAAFRIPDFIYNSFGIIFSVTVLIPFITERLKHDHEKGTQESLRSFMNSVFSVYVYGMIILLVATSFSMPLLTKFAAPGFSFAQQNELILFSRIMLLSPFLFGLSSLLSSFAQVQHKFFSFAIAPLFYNAGILIGIVFFRQFFGMLGVVLGVILGALMHFLIQIPTLAMLHKIPTLTRSIDWKLIRMVVKTSIPRTLGATLSNITFITMSALASLLAVGSISVFQFSYNIENTPFLIFGVSYAVAAFPTMAKHFLAGERRQLFAVLYRATRNVFFITMPVALLMIVLRAHIVRILLGAGQFSWNDTKLVAASVALFSISVTAQSMVLLLVRSFFSVGDTKTPLKVNGISALLTISTALGFVFSYHHIESVRYFVDSIMRIDDTVGGSVVLLALAYSIGQIVNAFVLWRIFHKKMNTIAGEYQSLARVLSHMVASAVLAATIAYGVLFALGNSIDQTHALGVALQAIGAALAGFLAYALILVALGNEDITLFLATIRSKFWKQKPFIPQQQDL